MTVCVAIKVHDCIVFAADSASSVMGISASGDELVSNIWEHGVKVFNLHKRLPVVGMTAGLGHFGPVSINTLTKNFRVDLMHGELGNQLNEEEYTIEGIVGLLNSYFSEKFAQIDPQPSPSSIFQFWVGGYGANDDHGSIWKIILQAGSQFDPQEIAGPQVNQIVTWGGQDQAIKRLIFGFDDNLQSLLVHYGATEEVAGVVLDELKKGTETPLVHSTMPVQDAINLADFLVEVTKKYFRFLPGANTVDGSTDIATVTKHEGFKWIKRKHYYPDGLNKLETDHAA